MSAIFGVIQCGRETVPFDDANADVSAVSTSTLDTEKSFTNSLAVMTRSKVGLFVRNPDDPRELVIVNVGLVTSYVHVNISLAVLEFPASSLKLEDETEILDVPSFKGENVAVY